MAIVTDIVAKIRAAVLGIEVRENIAKGIENINTEVTSTTAKQKVLETTFDGLIINAGSSNAEVVAARGSAVSLPARLSGADANFTKLKMNKIYLSDYADLVIGADWLPALNQASIDAGSTKLLVIHNGIHEISNNWILPSGAKVYFEQGAWLKLTANTTTGAAVTNVYNGGGTTTLFTEDIVLYNPQIDCNNIDGENALGFINCQHVYIYNPILKNGKHTLAKKGGRAIQFEVGDNGVKNCYVFNPSISNFSLGCNVQGWDTGPTVNINFINTMMENVDIPFNFPSPKAVTIDPNVFSVNVDGVNLKNCGRIHGDFGTPTEGGIITGDRCGCVTVRNVKIINDPEYGEIGGLIHGRFRQIVVENIEINATLTALFNTNLAWEVKTFTGAVPVEIEATNIKHRGSMVNVVTAYGAGESWLANTRLKDIEVDQVTGSILDTNAGGNHSSRMLNLHQRGTTYSISDMSFWDIVNTGNLFTYFNQGVKDQFQDVYHVNNAVANNVATSLFEVALPNSARVFIDYSVSIGFVASANATGASRRGSAVAIASSSGTIAFNVLQDAVNVALITLATQTLEVSLVKDEALDKVTLVVTQTNSSVVALPVTVHASVNAIAGTGYRPKVTLL